MAFAEINMANLPTSVARLPRTAWRAGRLVPGRINACRGSANNGH
jgi:hypothetical protein